MSSLSVVDPQFAAVAKALYGDSVDLRELWDICKGMPDSSTVHVRHPDGKKSLAAGLLVGTAAEGLATARTVRPALAAVRGATGASPLRRAAKLGELGLQGGNMAVGLLAARSLAGPRRKGGTVSKAAEGHMRPQVLVSSGARLRQTRRGMLTPVPVAKAVDLVFEGLISKVDTDKRQVFGWCSLSVVDGEPVVDLQGDYVPIEEIEKSAYSYVLKSRKGGDMHRRITKADGGPVHTADLIESMVFTPEKLAKMGLAADALPLGWWVGYHVNDEEQWAEVKAGRRLGFSIHGTGVRKPID